MHPVDVRKAAEHAMGVQLVARAPCSVEYARPRPNRHINSSRHPLPPFQIRIQGCFLIPHRPAPTGKPPPLRAEVLPAEVGGPAGGPDGGLQRPLLGWISSGEQRRRRLRGVAAEAAWREHPPAALERRPRRVVLAAAAPAACVKGGRRLRCGVPGRLPPPPPRTHDPMTTQRMKSRVAREQGRRVVGEAPTPR